MGVIGVSRRAPSDAVLKVGGRRAKYGGWTRQIWHGSLAFCDTRRGVSQREVVACDAPFPAE